MVREVPVIWLRFADLCARGSGAGAAAHEASANAARRSRSGRARGRMTRRAHGSRPGAVTAQHSLTYPALTPIHSSLSLNAYTIHVASNRKYHTPTFTSLHAVIFLIS